MATLVATPKAIAEALEWRKGEDYTTYDKRSGEAFAKLQAENDALPEGEVVGALIQFPRADGYATYRVASKKPLKLQHIPHGDAWHADPATIRGLRLEEVQRMVAGRRRLRDMFASRRQVKEGA
ncbi:MAG: hypothetical protein KJZ92_14125 [Rhodocyclaceae bacterium]|nr:hypothetical protein [Rhodocyclaceae bacterium]